MAVKTGRGAVTAASQCPVDRAPKPGFETLAWLFMRVSGLALVFLALVHFGITHIVNDVTETDFNFVANRWKNPAWRAFDWMLLALALFHGVIGLRYIIDDYVRKPVPRGVVKTVVYGLSGFLFAYGTLTIVGFQPLG